MKSVDKSRDEALSKLHKSVITFIEGPGRQYIELKSSNNKMVNCPQGHVEMPVDVWHCKTTKKCCPIQAHVDLTSKDKFFEYCLVSEERKNGIWNAINEGSYKGFHHVVGRYQCGICDNAKINFNNHYPWELTPLSEHCDIESIWSNIERAKELISKDFPRAALYTALCCDCFKKVARLFPEIDLLEYEIITYIYQRSK